MTLFLFTDDKSSFFKTIPQQQDSFQIADNMKDSFYKKIKLLSEERPSDKNDIFSCFQKIFSQINNGDKVDSHPLEK